MTDGKIKVGLIGLGRAGWGMHAGELLKYHDMFQITAACDLDLSRPRQLCTRLGRELHVSADYRDILHDPEVELVAIACRSPEHTAYALEALKAGKYVVLDKPVSMNYAEAKKLLAASKKHPGKLFCRQNRRFEPEFNHVLEIMDSGVLGKIYMIRHSIFSYQRRNDWQTILRWGGGQLNNWGPHLLDHAVQLMGAKIRHADGYLRKVTAVGDAEDFFKILLEGINGRIVDVEFSGGAALRSNIYEVHGDRGSLILDPSMKFHLRYLDPEVPLKAIKAESGTPAIEGLGWAPYCNPEKLVWIEKDFPVAPHNDDNLTTIYKHVYRAIREGVPYRVKVEESVEVVRITEMIRKQNPRFFRSSFSHFKG